MKRALILSAACLLLATPAGAQPPMTGEGDYLPLQKGTTWTYRVTGKKEKIILKVVGEVKVGDATCSRLEMSINGMVLASECVVVKQDGIYRVKVGDQLVNPPLCFLKLPAKKGTTWEVKSKVGTEEISGKFAEGEVELKAFWEKEKERQDQKVQVVTSETRNLNVNGQSLSLTYTFAPGVGIVRQVGTVAGATVTLELEKFDLPNPMP